MDEASKALATGLIAMATTPTRHRLRPIATAWLACTLFLAACGGKTNRTGTRTRSVASICDGMIGSEPTVLATGLAPAWLHTEQDHIVAVEYEGRVQRIDRCTGETRLLAENLGSSQYAALTHNHVFVSSRANGSDYARSLHQISKYGDGEPNLIAGVNPSQLLGDATAIYFEDYTVDTVQVYSMNASTADAHLLADLPISQGEAWRTLRGVSSEGLYYTHGYTGCCAALTRLPLDGNELVPVPGAEAAAGQ